MKTIQGWNRLLLRAVSLLSFEYSCRGYTATWYFLTWGSVICKSNELSQFSVNFIKKRQLNYEKIRILVAYAAEFEMGLCTSIGPSAIT